MSDSSGRVDLARRRRWQKRYRYDRLRGRSHAPVDARPVREHVNELLELGFTATSIARAAGLPHDTVLGVAQGYSKGREPGRDTVQRPTAAKLLRVDIARIIECCEPHHLLPRVGAQRRVRALQAQGWTIQMIADAVDGLTYHNVKRAIYQGRPGEPREQISKLLHSQIVQAYDELSMRQGPSKHTRTLARRRDFPTPLCWDDETIDDPRALPDRGAAPSGGAMTREDVAFLVEGGVRTWGQLVERTGRTSGYLRIALQRDERQDLIDRLDIASYGERMTGGSLRPVAHRRTRRRAA